MVLRMKNFNILGVHWKIRLLGVGGSRKTNVEGGLPKKGALVSLPIYGGDLARKRVVVFLQGDLYDNTHYEFWSISATLYNKVWIYNQFLWVSFLEE